MFCMDNKNNVIAKISGDNAKLMARISELEVNLADGEKTFNELNLQLKTVISERDAVTAEKVDCVIKLERVKDVFERYKEKYPAK